MLACLPSGRQMTPLQVRRRSVQISLSLEQENPTLSGEASCTTVLVWHSLGLFPVLALVLLDLLE